MLSQASQQEIYQQDPQAYMEMYNRLKQEQFMSQQAATALQNEGQLPEGFNHYSNLHDDMDEEDIAAHAQRLKKNRIFDDEEEDKNDDNSEGSCSDEDEEESPEDESPDDVEELDSDVEVDLDSQHEYFNESDGSQAEDDSTNSQKEAKAEDSSSPDKMLNGESEIQKFAEESTQLTEEMKKLVIDVKENGAKAAAPEDKENIEVETTN
jgi:hypothetical protein